MAADISNTVNSVEVESSNLPNIVHDYGAK